MECRASKSTSSAAGVSTTLVSAGLWVISCPPLASCCPLLPYPTLTSILGGPTTKIPVLYGCHRDFCYAIEYRLSLPVQLQTRDGRTLDAVAHRYPTDRFWDYAQICGAGTRSGTVRCPGRRCGALAFNCSEHTALSSAAPLTDIYTFADGLSGGSLDCWYKPSDPAGSVALSASLHMPQHSLQEAITGRLFGIVFAVPLAILTLWLWWLPFAIKTKLPVCCCCDAEECV